VGNGVDEDDEDFRDDEDDNDQNEKNDKCGLCPAWRGPDDGKAAKLKFSKTHNGEK